MKSLAEVRQLRRIVIPVLSRINVGDISIHHHYTGEKFRLHSFRHKGYWYHGKAREASTMTLFATLIKAGNTVIEIGGHIGYISLYFSQLVGDAGHVFVFEPGVNNLPYLRRNLARTTNTTVIEEAVGDMNGQVPFYLEGLTGQNNTLLPDIEVFKNSVKNAFVDAQYREVKVDVIRLDDFLRERSLRPDFIKIDVEGAERAVIGGMLSCLAGYRPALMIEVSREQESLYDILTRNGYLLFDPERHVVHDYREIKVNTFCLHRENHRAQLQGLHLESFIDSADT